MPHQIKGGIGNSPAIAAIYGGCKVQSGSYTPKHISAILAQK